MSIHKNIFIFIGPPGAGKGSLSQLCVKKHSWGQLSTGDLCRRHIADKTVIGKQIDFIIQSGKLIPDSLIIEMVEGWLLEKFKNLDTLILDGFPRTVTQAEALDKLLEKNIFSAVKFHVIELKIDDSVVIERLSSRLICPNRGCSAVYSNNNPKLAPKVPMMCDDCSGVQLVVRADDTPESVKRRLETYHKHAQELINYYKNSGKVVHELMSIGSLEEVYADFIQLIGFELK